MGRRGALAVAVCCWLRLAHAEESDSSSRIEVWTRAPGTYGGDHEEVRAHALVIDLETIPLVEGTLKDAQYGVERKYRYVPLEEILRRYGPSTDCDTALLHFSNGMAIPVPFRAREAMQRLRPAIAREAQVDGAWTRSLPVISRTDAFYFDTRPLRFVGNKMVVAELWHPSLRPGTEQAFSPWRLADTLTGIELTSDRAYLAQFAVSTATARGQKTYGEVCRFCHGARRQGAQFGWDFVEPLPISEYRKKDVSLYYHLKYRAASAVTRGILMPALPFLNEADAADLLAWLRALAARPLAPYRP